MNVVYAQVLFAVAFCVSVSAGLQQQYAYPEFPGVPSVGCGFDIVKQRLAQCIRENQNVSFSLKPAASQVLSAVPYDINAIPVGQNLARTVTTLLSTREEASSFLYTLTSKTSSYFGVYHDDHFTTVASVLDQIDWSTDLLVVSSQRTQLNQLVWTVPGTSQMSGFRSAFMNAVDELPVPFSGNEDWYFRFLQTFGTHVVTTETMGGHVLYWMRLSKDVLSVFERSEVIKESSKGFNIWFARWNRNSDMEQMIQQMSETFKLYVKDERITQGGFTGSFEEFAETLQQFPAVDEVHTVEIASLITDENKAKALRDAVEAYVAKASA